MALDFLDIKSLTTYRNRQVLGLLALGVGLSVLVSLTPLHWGIMILLACILVAAALYEPMYALTLVLLLGPSRALLGAVC